MSEALGLHGNTIGIVTKWGNMEQEWIFPGVAWLQNYPKSISMTHPVRKWLKRTSKEKQTTFISVKASVHGLITIERLGKMASMGGFQG